MAGKKRGGNKKGSALDLAELDDAGSAASSSTNTMFLAHDTDNTVTDEFADKIDELFEKRGSTRESALEGLLRFMREEVRAEDCYQNQSTLVSRCVNGLRKGSAQEAALSAQLLATLMVSLPEPDESLFSEFHEELVQAALHGKSSGARAAAMEGLAMAAFVAAGDDHATRDVLEQLARMWGAGDAKCRSAAVRSWTFLFTSLNSLLPASVVEERLARLGDLLHHEEVEVRNAAGEAIALIFATCGVNSLVEDEDEDYGQDDESVSDSAMSGLDDVVGRMRDLASSSMGARAPGDKLRVSKRAKASQRAAFRELLSSVEGGSGAVRAEKIKLRHGDVLVVDSLAGRVMLSGFRRCLAGGFQEHLQCNPLLHSVFSFSPACERPERLSYLEKRHMRSPSSASAKGRTADRKHGRAHKSALMAVGEDY